VTGVTLLMVMKAITNSNTKADPQGATVLVGDSLSSGPILATRPSLRDRLTAHWHPRRLDRALADGTPPEASAALALRARELTELERRQSIADAIRRVLREGREGAPRRSGRIRPERSRVVAASEELSVLADTLADPGPVTAAGVAQAWLLLTDGTGPLYNECSRTNLGSRAARAARDLRPWPA
jgi:hypothetical protein